MDVCDIYGDCGVEESYCTTSGPGPSGGCAADFAYQRYVDPTVVKCTNYWTTWKSNAAYTVAAEPDLLFCPSDGTKFVTSAGTCGDCPVSAYHASSCT
jgi:hypothetical protein